VGRPSRTSSTRQQFAAHCHPRPCFRIHPDEPSDAVAGPEEGISFRSWLGRRWIGLDIGTCSLDGPDLRAKIRFSEGRGLRHVRVCPVHTRGMLRHDSPSSTAFLDQGGKGLFSSAVWLAADGTGRMDTRGRPPPCSRGRFDGWRSANPAFQASSNPDRPTRPTARRPTCFQNFKVAMTLGPGGTPGGFASRGTVEFRIAIAARNQARALMTRDGDWSKRGTGDTA